ncbi:MAG TPA: endonuclease/exonuclease/phosphatase family protein [Candidatus Bilamarchaeum sp.]|nr:endonuclease/exonuclease/phosphatase family protein [Candidatus Bilamarchaeum sp.]
MRAVFLALAMLLVMGCISPPPQPNQTVNNAPNQSVPANNTNHTNQTAPPQNITQTLRIAAFNIQIFGESKRSKPGIMDVLSKTARNFDVMLVEELRDDTETTLPFYLESINALPGPKYAAVSSPRLGRTSSKENYAYVYNTEKVQLLSNYTFADPPNASSPDLFQREPFVARFQSGNFSFVLIGIHTQPDDTVAEINRLPLVLDDAMQKFPSEKDFIVLGDLNADCTYLKASDNLTLKNSSFTWVVPDSADTTTKSTDCTYDRIILSDNESFSGNWGVFRFDTEYGLNQSFTEQVSDHYPVWADFNP